jgi:hypothetical protein
MAVFSLVERDGKARSFHIANVTAESVRPLIKAAASRESHFRTDESGIYRKVGEEFASHKTVVLRRCRSFGQLPGRIS